MYLYQTIRVGYLLKTRISINLFKNERLLCKYACRNLATRSHHHKQYSNPVIDYLRRLKWVPIPIGVGFAYISYQQYGHVRKREELKQLGTADPGDLLAKEWVVSLYRCLPLRALSRAWGYMHNLNLPVWLREPVYKCYIWAFNCHMDEAAIRDLQHYRNLGEFFKRRLRPDARPIDGSSCLTSPSDGCVLYFGKADLGRVEQVKGVKYSLWQFLGPTTWNSILGGIEENEETHDTTPNVLSKFTGPKGSQYEASLKTHADSELYHVVIYLAPGDYHGFHSPTEWVVNFRRHFPGELLSVNPGIARLVKGLFNYNERVVYTGSWKHGFFAMSPVGATNVGSMKVYHDKDLETNCPGKFEAGCFSDMCFVRAGSPGIEMKRGEGFGEFNLGSTIVLIFEAPKDFEFNLEVGQTVKMGQALGCTTSDNMMLAAA